MANSIEKIHLHAFFALKIQAKKSEMQKKKQIMHVRFQNLCKKKSKNGKKRQEMHFNLKIHAKKGKNAFSI